MGKYRLKFLPVLFLLVLPCFSQVRPYQIFITGRVVDERGRPRPDAEIDLLYPAGVSNINCALGGVHPTTDVAGTFVIEEQCDQSKRGITLFTWETTPFRNAEFPIMSPYWDELRKIDPRFAGKTIELSGSTTEFKRDERMDVGEIPVQVWFNLVEVFVLDKSGEHLYKNEDEWSNFVLIVRHPNGTVVGEAGLSISDVENNVRVDRGSVRVALPEGAWTLELLRSLDDFDQSGRTLRRLAKTTVTVKKTDVCLQAKFVVDRNELSKK